MAGGEIGELRGLIVVGSFLACFVLLFSFIPYGYNISGYGTSRTVNIPEYFESADLPSFAQTHNTTLTNVTGSDTAVIGGWIVSEWWGAANGTRYTFFTRSDQWWIFTWIAEGFHFYKDGVLLGATLSNWRLDEDYHVLGSDNETILGLANLHYMIECSTCRLHIYYAFDEAAYDLPSEAWDASKLYVLWGIEWDQVNTSYNAWDIMSGILFFRIPSIHFAINAIIAIPIWICVAYLTVMIAFRIIEALKPLG